MPSYVPMCTPTLPDVPRAPASLLSSLLMMRATPLRSLTDTIGRVVPLKFVKIVSLVVAPVSVVVVALAVALAVVAASAVLWAVEALLVAEALAADSLDVAASVVPLVATVVSPVPADLSTAVLLLFPPDPLTHSLIMPLPTATRALSSMFAT